MNRQEYNLKILDIIKVKAQDVLENVEKELTENEQEKTLEEIKNKIF